MKTARFKDIVAKFGRPQLHLIWSAPASDKVLQAATSQHRVLTIYQQIRGSKKDYGVVGLEIAPHAQYLLFPKSLKTLADQRIVGIQYELLQEKVSSGEKLTPRGRPQVKVKEISQKIVQFPRPISELAPETLNEKQSPAEPVIRAAVREKSAETDPVKKEVRGAIDDLKAGRVEKARRRLEAVLKKN